MPSAPPRSPWWVLGAYAMLAVPVLCALYAWEGQAYIEYSDGVYVYTSHAVTTAAGLYRDVAAAQPPGIFWLGSGVLHVHDSIEALRIAMGLVALAQGALVTLAVWRLTESRPAAVTGAVASLLGPWALLEHTALLPETVGSPILLGAALLAARPERAASVAAGALAALSVAVKVSFALPAVAIGALAVRRGRYAVGLAVAGGVLLVAFLALYGQDGWDDVVTAQRETGGARARYVFELWAQAAWNEGPLLLVALGTWLLRSRASDPALLRTLLALLLSAGLLVATLFKNGTYLQVVLVMEAPAVALATACVVWGVRSLRESGTRTARARAPAAAVVAALVLTAAQSASVLRSPTEPRLVSGPWSTIDMGWQLGRGATDAAERRARRCPAGIPYSGHPYVAYIADRRMPGNQPDQFILTEAPRAHEEELRAVQADRARCP